MKSSQNLPTNKDWLIGSVLVLLSFLPAIAMVVYANVGSFVPIPFVIGMMYLGAYAARDYRSYHSYTATAVQKIALGTGAFLIVLNILFAYLWVTHPPLTGDARKVADLEEKYTSTTVYYIYQDQQRVDKLFASNDTLRNADTNLLRSQLNSTRAEYLQKVDALCTEARTYKNDFFYDTAPTLVTSCNDPDTLAMCRAAYDEMLARIIDVRKDLYYSKTNSCYNSMLYMRKFIPQCDNIWKQFSPEDQTLNQTMNDFEKTCDDLTFQNTQKHLQN